MPNASPLLRGGVFSHPDSVGSPCAAERVRGAANRRGKGVSVRILRFAAVEAADPCGPHTEPKFGNSRNNAYLATESRPEATPRIQTNDTKKGLPIEKFLLF